MVDEQDLQCDIVERITALGWTHVPANQLMRDEFSVLHEPDLIGALLRLNPVIAEQPERVDEVLPRIRAVVTSAVIDGLVEANRRMTSWMRGMETFKFASTDAHVHVRLIDFENLAANRLVVSGPGFGQRGHSTEVTYAPGHARFDVVLWVNGLPVVIGETKTPVLGSVSWLNGARDIRNSYEVNAAPFFVPNVLSWATEGKEFHYGAVGQPAEEWLKWGNTADPLTLTPAYEVQRSMELLLNPTTLLEIVDDFTLYDRPKRGGPLVKLLPRYPQREAAKAIHGRVLDPARRGGLIWQYQGSGKTLAMAYAALRMLNDPETSAPTILCVLDRVDLIEQTTRQFRGALPPEVPVQVASSSAELRKMLAEDRRGLVMTTVFRFKDAPADLNTRSNVIVLIDEAHRTQEGLLGEHMRRSLPNARFFGLTGTPVAYADHNTFKLFGDPDDEGYVLNRYSQARSVKDGTTVPIHVESRLVNWHLDAEALDQAYDELAEEEGLTDEQKDLIVRKASKTAAWLKNPDRIRDVCADIVDHFYAKIDPLGMKAQVVAYDRELCVAYHAEISRLLVKRGIGDEVKVVMTVSDSKGERPKFKPYGLTDTEEETVKDRFRDHADPLKFLVVTSKLLTGFDAPNEGVMYLDKPLRLHALSQTMTRVNRRFTHPVSGQEKTHGLIVDYSNLGNEVAKALRDANPETGGPKHVDVAGLAAELEEALKRATWPRFAGLFDPKNPGYQAILHAQERLATPEEREAFAADMVPVTTLWEFLYPNSVLDEHVDTYRWLVNVYESIKPSSASDAILWARLGAKTLALVHAHSTIDDIEKVGPDVVLDDETIEAIRKLAELEGTGSGREELTVDDALDTIGKRLKRTLSTNGHPVYRTLAERLEALRERSIAGAKQSQEFLEDLLKLARQVLEAERADEDDRLDEAAAAILDPRIGALTQIFNEYAPPNTPVVVEKVVLDIDGLVKETATFQGWADSPVLTREVKQELRKRLRKYQLPVTGDLFDHAWAYIAEHY
jgi:type I restriction enzyme R subunit